MPIVRMIPHAHVFGWPRNSGDGRLQVSFSASFRQSSVFVVQALAAEVVGHPNDSLKDLFLLDNENPPGDLCLLVALGKSETAQSFDMTLVKNSLNWPGKPYRKVFHCVPNSSFDALP